VLTLFILDDTIAVQAKISTIAQSAKTFQNNNIVVSDDRSILLDSNVTNLISGIDKPVLLKKVLMGSLQQSKPFFGAPQEIIEPRKENETALAIEQEQEQSMENKTLDKEIAQKNVIRFDNISNHSSHSRAMIKTAQLSGPVLKFEGLASELSGGHSPPDVTLAVGPRHVVQMVNIQLAIWTKQAEEISVSTLNQFFLTGTDMISDPKIFFDNGSKRWFASIMDRATNSVHVAVSTNDDPTNEWNVYNFPFINCPDQPYIGVSNDKFVISVNTEAEHCRGNFSGVQFTIAQKKDLLNGINPKFVQSIPDKSVFSLRPSQSNYPDSISTLSMVSIRNEKNNAVMLLTLDGSIPNLKSRVDFLPIRATNSPPKAIQPGTLQMISLGDDRVLDMKSHNGKLWFTSNDGCIPPDDKRIRSCVRLIEVNTTNKTILQDFDVAINKSYLFFPALNVDTIGDLVVVCGISSNAVFPSIIVFRLAVDDSPSFLQPPLILRNGTSADPNGVYGDYFAATIDPSKPGIFWAAGQYTSTTKYWSTYIGSYITSSNPPITLSTRHNEVSAIPAISKEGKTIGNNTMHPPLLPFLSAQQRALLAFIVSFAAISMIVYLASTITTKIKQLMNGENLEKANRKNFWGLVSTVDWYPSLSIFQFLLWTITIIFAFFAVYLTRIFGGIVEAPSSIPYNLLILIGISSVVPFVSNRISNTKYNIKSLQSNQSKDNKSKLSIMLKENDQLSFTRLQMFSWTWIGIMIYLVILFSTVFMISVDSENKGLNTLKDLSLPDIGPTLVILMGLSQGVYLVGKMSGTSKMKITDIVPSKGKDGQPIISILGAGFGFNKESVWFKDKEITDNIISWNDSRIDVKVPVRFNEGERYEIRVSNGLQSSNIIYVD
jgi:hypothetical protein